MAEDKRRKIVIPISGKAENGKDLTATLLKKELEKINYRVLILRNGDLLKWMGHQLGWNGQKDEAGRKFLQFMGTNVVRKQYDENFWVSYVKHMIEISLMMDLYDVYLIPDARFPNEIEFLDYNPKYSLVSMRVNRPGHISKLTQEQLKHESETALDNYSFDIMINATSIEELVQKIQKKVNDIFTIAELKAVK